jgi:UDP-N-acetylmuramoylalanine--D-glutamate ligase
MRGNGSYIDRCKQKCTQQIGRPCLRGGRSALLARMDLAQKRVTVMGLGHFGGGAAAARWLAEQGAAVTVTDTADDGALAEPLAALGDVPIHALHLGGHREADFREADLVVVNPAVRPESSFLQMARTCGVPLLTEVELFLRHCPSPVVGVTGSNGKSTTAAMIAAIVRASGRRTWLGGNIGRSLLPHLAEMTTDDACVLELSSFQLWHFSPDAPMPPVAVVTQCTTNHLDWHGTFDAYRKAKQRLIAEQQADGVAVLNDRDAEVAAWHSLAAGRVIAPAYDRVPPLRVPGEHNRINAACAAAAGAAAGCAPEAIEKGLSSFGGLPQRLELFAMIDGRRFYNDSTATTPESTIAALQSLDMPVWVLAGGRSKGFSFGPLAAAIVGRARGAAFFGAARDELLQEVRNAHASFACEATETLRDALDWCWRRSRPGEAIVLSPACASSDQFRNFRQRGEHFGELVQAMSGRLWA